jgi:hypothetical protein
MSAASSCPRRSTAEALDVVDVGKQDSCFQLGTGGKRCWMVLILRERGWNDGSMWHALPFPAASRLSGFWLRGKQRKDSRLSWWPSCCRAIHDYVNGRSCKKVKLKTKADIIHIAALSKAYPRCMVAIQTNTEEGPDDTKKCCTVSSLCW